MKEMLTITFIALAVFVCGCTFDSVDSREKLRLEEDHNAVKNFRRVEFEGHDYIIYRQQHGASQTFSGLTHDPDCPCIRFNSAMP